MSAEERKAKTSQYNRDYAIRNREKLRQYSRDYYAARTKDASYRDYHRERTSRWAKENPDAIRAFQRKYRQNLSEEQQEHRRALKRRLYHADIDRSREQQRQWREKNKARAIARAKAYVASLSPEKKEYYRQKQIEWRKENREHRREQSKTPQAKATRRRYLRKRWREDPQHKLGLILRNRINKALSSKAKAGSAVRYLGCSIKELREHLESLFSEGMTWDNWGVGDGTWQIDHISPVGMFDLTDPEQLAVVCHWSNLMPTWHEDHARKTVADTVAIRRRKRLKKK